MTGARGGTRATFAVLAASVGAYSLLQSLVLPVLPTIQHDLHTSQNTVTWVLTAYLLSASVFTPIFGRLGDMYGKGRMMVLALSTLAVGALLAALAPSIGVMIAARAIQGVGGGVLPLAFGIIRDEWPPEKVGGTVGIMAGLTAAGGGFGVVLSGPIVEVVDYHWLFWLPLIVLVLAAIAAHFLIPESTQRSEGRISWPPVILLTVWLVALLLAVSEGPTWGWGSGRVLGLLALAIVTGIGWVVVETKVAHPLIDMKMMRIPVVWTCNLVAFLFGIGLYATFDVIPTYVRTPAFSGYGFGASVVVSGLILLPQGVGMFAFSLGSGRLTARYGAKLLLVVGSSVSIFTFVMDVIWRNHLWQFAISMGLQGIGFGLAFAAMSALVVEGVPAHQTGVASGMNANIRTIGGSIGAAVVSSIITASHGPHGLPKESGYVHGFVFLLFSTVAAALAALLVPRVRRHLSAKEMHDAMPHAELGIVAGGTLIGSDPE
jgi:EmrB/QacA subfamily drug resistance transporter